MAGYNRVLSRLAPLRKTQLLTLYLRAYPGCDADLAAAMSRDALIAGLLDYADRPPVRRAGGSVAGRPGEAS